MWFDAVAKNALYGSKMIRKDHHPKVIFVNFLPKI